MEKQNGYAALSAETKRGYRYGNIRNSKTSLSTAQNISKKH